MKYTLKIKPCFRSSWITVHSELTGKTFESVENLEELKSYALSRPWFVRDKVAIFDDNGNTVLQIQ